MSHEKLEKIFSGLRPGETVLIEYEPASSPELLFYLLFQYCKSKGIDLIVDDIGDTLIEFMTRLKLTGLATPELEKTDVMKIGGYRNIGRLIGAIELDRYTLDFKYYEKIYDKWQAGKGTVFNPVLGMHKIFMMSERNEAIRLVRNISEFVGNTARIAFYFINQKTLQESTPEVLYLLEEISTSILKWERKCESATLRVIKASNHRICGEMAVLSAKDILEYR